MTKNLAWTKAEICKLFDMVEKYKKNNKPLLKAFQDFADRFARKCGSVRNFYYSQIKMFEASPQICKEWGINLDNHKKKPAKPFSVQEEQKLLLQIENLVQKGHSVRFACKMISGGDVTEMLRLQNKYHALNAKKTNLDNVVFMPQKKGSLSEGEISSLVLGLVKLVKKTAEEKAEESLKNKILSANFELRKSIKALADKQREVELLRKNFEILTTEKQKIEEEMKSLRCQNVELLKLHETQEKISSLKSYVKKLSQNPAIKT
ncbi:MAG: hypothetical protein IKY15_02730 [Clostridia bacterium]|nr:hypothetical protein [Clostridia bacterium]